MRRRRRGRRHQGYDISSLDVCLGSLKNNKSSQQFDRSNTLDLHTSFFSAKTSSSRLGLSPDSNPGPAWSLLSILEVLVEG